ncbi:MAG: hypothetical protein E6K03_03070 [Methanobacteriota archaeon]|nr:MAG: hypothetical protein E6K03_03070 [Euryarchaeota archaeon]
MSGPSPGPSPGSPSPFSPAAPPPTGPPFYPGFYPPPPPRRSNITMIIVIVVVVAVLVPAIFAAVLYIMVSGLLQGPNPPIIVSFGQVDQAGGNATITVLSSSREIAPSSLQVRVAANGSGSSTGMPPPGGSVVLIAGGYSLRVFWLDDNNDQLFGTGDALRVTGDSAPLPSSTRFSLEISLVTSSGSMVSGVTWTTA